MRCSLVVVALSAIFPLARQLPAQSTEEAASAFAPRPAVSLSAGVSQFDLSGTGSMGVVAARGELPILPALLLEGGVTLARPEQQFSDRSTLVMPEIQLQLQLPRRVAPYLGIGTGFATDVASERYGGTNSEVTFAESAGLRAAITRQVGLRVELRIREFGEAFSGTTADWTLGAAWRF
ncbi:MAG TPA: outer membrane beta-barrel protein [Gemmatimonadaceae bacterium]|jgi:hypothetical protein